MTPLDRLRATFPASDGWECCLSEDGPPYRVCVSKANECGDLTIIRFVEYGPTPAAAVDAVIAAHNALVEGSARVKELVWKCSLNETVREIHERNRAVRAEDERNQLAAQLAAARAEIGLLQRKVVEVADQLADTESARQSSLATCEVLNIEAGKLRAQLAAEREHRARKNDATVKP